MVHHQDLERVEKSIADQIEGNPRNFDYVEYRMIAKDGSVKWIEVFYVFITDKMKESLKEKKEMMSRSVDEWNVMGDNIPEGGII